MVEGMRLLKEEALEPEAIRFSPENLAKLIVLVDNGTITRTVAKEVFEKYSLKILIRGLRRRKRA